MNHDLKCCNRYDALFHWNLDGGIQREGGRREKGKRERQRQIILAQFHSCVVGN